MAVFTGEYECKIDAKGRLVLPARIKNAFPEPSGEGAPVEIMLRMGFEPCLVLYPITEYKKIFSRIAGLNEFNAEYRALQRNFFRGNAHVELDSMGRFLIPRSMLKHANLTKAATVVGIGNRVEIWDPEEYDRFLITDQEEFSALAQKYLDS